MWNQQAVQRFQDLDGIWTSIIYGALVEVVQRQLLDFVVPSSNLDLSWMFVFVFMLTRSTKDSTGGIHEYIVPPGLWRWVSAKSFST